MLLDEGGTSGVHVTRETFRGWEYPLGRTGPSEPKGLNNVGKHDCRKETDVWREGATGVPSFVRDQPRGLGRPLSDPFFNRRVKNCKLLVRERGDSPRKEKKR